jgi:EmrB/QacA subfamily drug resistance transporter
MNIMEFGVFKFEYCEKSQSEGKFEMDTNKSNIRLTIIGLMLGLFMASLDQTIVSTAMPKVIDSLHGFDKFIWVYSAYMIAMVVATPLFGKLSDMYGRKRFYILGLLLFIIGSMLCGVAQNMDQLILYRAIQGIGGGALMPIVFTIIFDLFPPKERGKMTGLFGAVFGLSSVFGPILGAYLTDHVHWRWIFYINAPIGILSFLLILRAYHESKSFRKQTIDWLGAILLTAGLLGLMFGLELGGTDHWAWDSARVIGLFAACAVSLAFFLYAETKAKDPIVPLGLFKDRVFTSSQLIGFLYGGVMIAGATYIPLYVQGVFQESATSTGLILTPMMLGVVASSMTGGILGSKVPFRNIMLISAVVLLGSVYLLGTLDMNTSRTMITLYMVLMGLGMGVSFSVLNMSALTHVPPQNKGTATSLVSFFRSIGTALGITVLGSLQRAEFQSGAKAVVGDNPALFDKVKSGQELFSPQASQFLDPTMTERLLKVLADSIVYLFQWAIVIPLVALIFVFLLGNARVITASKEKGKVTPEETQPSYHGG